MSLCALCGEEIDASANDNDESTIKCNVCGQFLHTKCLEDDQQARNDDHHSLHCHGCSYQGCNRNVHLLKDLDDALVIKKDQSPFFCAAHASRNTFLSHGTQKRARVHSASCDALTDDDVIITEQEVCDICLSDEADADDHFIFCDGPGCGLVVHKSCYGIGDDDAAAEYWYCDACRAAGNMVNSPRPAAVPPCGLCPCAGGAKKLTTTGTYAHFACVRDVARGRPYRAPDGFLLAGAGSGKPCCVCNRPDGATAACTDPACDATFHISCADRVGCLKVPRQLKGHPTLVQYCPACTLRTLWRLGIREALAGWEERDAAFLRDHPDLVLGGLGLHPQVDLPFAQHGATPALAARIMLDMVRSQPEYTGYRPITQAADWAIRPARKQAPVRRWAVRLSGRGADLALHGADLNLPQTQLPGALTVLSDLTAADLLQQVMAGMVEAGVMANDAKVVPPHWEEIRGVTRLADPIGLVARTPELEFAFVSQAVYDAIRRPMRFRAVQSPGPLLTGPLVLYYRPNPAPCLDFSAVAVTVVGTPDTPRVTRVVEQLAQLGALVGSPEHPPRPRRVNAVVVDEGALWGDSMAQIRRDPAMARHRVWRLPEMTPGDNFMGYTTVDDIPTIFPPRVAVLGDCPIESDVIVRVTRPVPDISQARRFVCTATDRLDPAWEQVDAGTLADICCGLQ
ncbi:PHD-zinc-finger like domain [Carpediemonas membranifera]|uniref:PHD-zinc-finger like domain n=1 Tax=Carpediemonas membranifera TaxID=201153 RepID=A0A8J6B3I8_9EUKA|nr:PHD-zinc-finger like domain [Carpediemonas membranifera]|eukprot:KAG9394953.1 PHD-zinc-finger like domain [Carpediemonas membranifera]